MRRYRYDFGAVGAVAIALLIGLGTSTWLFFKERESRREAELGRANEVILRQQAEAREKIAEAAVLLNQNQFAAADRLLSQCLFPETVS